MFEYINVIAFFAIIFYFKDLVEFLRCAFSDLEILSTRASFARDIFVCKFYSKNIKNNYNAGFSLYLVNRPLSLWVLTGK